MQPAALRVAHDRRALGNTYRQHLLAKTPNARERKYLPWRYLLHLDGDLNVQRESLLKLGYSSVESLPGRGALGPVVWEADSDIVWAT